MRAEARKVLGGYAARIVRGGDNFVMDGKAFSTVWAAQIDAWQRARKVGEDIVLEADAALWDLQETKGGPSRE